MLVAILRLYLSLLNGENLKKKTNTLLKFYSWSSMKFNLIKKKNPIIQILQLVKFEILWPDNHIINLKAKA